MVKMKKSLPTATQAGRLKFSLRAAWMIRTCPPTKKITLKNFLLLDRP